MRKFLIVLIISFAFPIWAEDIAPFVMPSARYAALGGNHAALADDFYALFTNPAAFVGKDVEFSAAEVSLSVYGPAFEIMDLLSSNSGKWDNLDTSNVVGETGFAAGLDMGGPIAFGWVGDGLGLGIFSRMKADATVSGAQLQPTLATDILLTGGYAHRFISKGSHVLDAGFLGKGYFRSGLDFSSSIFGAEKMFDKPFQRPFTAILGIGFDLGVKYIFAENLTFALVCFDAFSPSVVTVYESMASFQKKEAPLEEGHFGKIKPRLDFGVKYTINSDFLARYFSNIIVLTDYHDIIDLAALIPRNPILNVGIGLEVILLEKLSLRAGIADALPAVGFGLDLTFMRFDCAVHGKELGLDPGVHSVYAVDFAFLFRY